MEINLALLSTTHIPPLLENLPGTPEILTTHTPATDLPPLFEGRETKLWCLDFETKGDWAHSDGYPVGVALACDEGSVYIALTDSHPDTLRVLVGILAQNNIQIIAHNAFFDAGWVFRYFTPDANGREGLGQKEPGLWLNWKCSYALYRYLASEGYPGQKYGLKDAQISLLGWQEKGDIKLDNWLIENGHFSSVSRVRKKGYYYYPAWTEGKRECAGEEGPEECEDPDRWVSAKKEMMYLAPADILGEYARLDAMSTLALYTNVLLPVMEQFEGLQWYYHEVFSRVLYTLVWQKCVGMKIDETQLDAHASSLEEKIAYLGQKFISHPDTAPHIKAYREQKVKEHKEKEPAKHLKNWPPKKPNAQFKKDGTQTKAWGRYLEKLEAGPTVSKNWTSWQAKLEEIQQSEPFNLNSGQQRAWLFHEAMGHPIIHTTETGLPKTDETALKSFGEPGKILIDYITSQKELGFNASLKGVLNQATRRYHPSLRLPGTHTGRLSGAGGFNCFTEDAEYLTKRGWVGVIDLCPDDEVWQVNPKTKQGSWAAPLAIIKKQFKGEIYAFGGKRGELKVTPEHRMCWYGGKNQDYKYLYTFPAEELPDTVRATMLHSSFSCSDSSHSVSEIWKAAAIQADGSRYIKRGKDMGRWKIGVRKQRKIDKLNELFGPPTYIYDYVTLWDLKFESDLLDIKTKTLSLQNLGTEHAATLVEAITFWDGTLIKGHTVEYSSALEKNVDELQAYLSRAGYSATKKKYRNIYRLYITKTIHKEIRLRNETEKAPLGVRKLEYDGLVGCVTVEDGHILVRQAGRTWVTGNCQNPPKSSDFLRCFTVPEDYVIITCDHSSLEDYVLAELSRDMSLWDFYGPDSRKGNCMYLSVGSRLPVLGDKIKEAGYNPDGWTPESVKAAKKKASKWRQVAKAIVLGANYGASPKTLHKQLTDNNIDIDIDDVFKMHKGFWKLRRGVKVWEKELKRQWEDNGGWILNGIGRPICLEPMRDKDLVNATVQSSGHDAHMLFQVLIAEHLSRDGFDWHPWHMDMHDCSMFAVRADQAEAACNLLTYVVYPELNKMLGGEIALKGDPNVCITWADDKDEERKWEEDSELKKRIWP